MTDPIVIVTGSAGGQWPDWLVPWLPQPSDAPAGGSATRAVIDTPPEGVPLGAPPAPAIDAAAAAGYLLVAEHPARGLARALAAGSAPDPTAWLDTWCTSARRLLRLAQCAPVPTLMIDAEEAARDPQALHAACEERLDLRLGLDGAAMPAAVDPLALALAEASVGASEATEALAAELLASCQPLSGNDAGAWWAPRWADRLDAAAAARCLQRLQALPQALAEAHEATHRLQSELAAAQAERQAQAEAAARARDEAQAELSAAREQQGSLQRELEAARTSLKAESTAHQAERERAKAAAGRAEAAVAQAVAQATRLQQAHDALQHQGQALQQQLAERQAQAEAATRARDEARAESRRQEDALGAAAREQASAQQENELLLLQLHQVQEELEQYYLQCRELQTMADAEAARVTPVPGVVEVSIGDIQLLAERDTPPHRELTCSVRQVRAGDREVPQATVRLVEHHGRPGLVVFGDADEPRLFAAWQASGSEGDRPYALLVPDDPNAVPLLEAMDSADWLLLQALVLRLESLLQAPPAGLQPSWCTLARRLREALQELPPRLRHLGLQVDKDAAGTQTLHFRQVHWGARQLARVSVQWLPGTNRLALLAGDGDTGTPLPSWPCDERGLALPHLELPLTDDDPGAREAWQRLGASDRAFLLDLLDIWPPTLGTEADDGATTGAANLRAQAESMLAPRPQPAAPPAAPAGLMRRVARRLLRRRAGAAPDRVTERPSDERAPRAR